MAQIVHNTERRVVVLTLSEPECALLGMCSALGSKLATTVHELVLGIPVEDAEALAQSVSLQATLVSQHAGARLLIERWPEEFSALAQAMRASTTDLVGAMIAEAHDTLKVQKFLQSLDEGVL